MGLCMASEWESQTEMNRKDAGDFCPRKLATVKIKRCWVLRHSNASTWEVEAGGSEFKVIFRYRDRSRPA